jgi:hypothetical protein
VADGRMLVGGAVAVEVAVEVGVLVGMPVGVGVPVSGRGGAGGADVWRSPAPLAKRLCRADHRDNNVRC